MIRQVLLLAGSPRGQGSHLLTNARGFVKVVIGNLESANVLITGRARLI